MSISSSNERLPKLPFGRIWLSVGFSLVLFILCWDSFWIFRGVLPLPKDDANLWSYHRRRVSREDSVVLIGSSKMQTGLDQPTFSDLTGRKTIQLAIVGQSPIPILRNLAEDESFKGTVVSDFSEYLIYQAEVNPDYYRVPGEWLKAYQESKTTDDFEFRLRSYGAYFVVNPSLGENSADALKNLVTGKVFEKQGLEHLMFGSRPTFFDRSMNANIDNFVSQELKQEIIEKARIASVRGLREMIEKYPPQPGKFLEIANRIEGYVKTIQARGGKVVIVNFPMSGELEALNEVAFPRKDFWSEFSKNSSAVTIHYRDYPQLKFECIDGSHLDPKDTPKFTESLLKILAERDSSFALK